LIPFIGVDITHTFAEDAGAEKLLVAWVRCAMGLKSSPYYTARCENRAKRLCMGNPKLEYSGVDLTMPKNQFHWDHVWMNCPGDSHYDSTFPWMAKIDLDGKIATNIHQYIDDNRTTVPTVDESWLAGSQWAKTCSYLGIQDASRKRREAAQKGGAWAGGVAHCDERGVWKLITQERWEKAKSNLAKLDEALKEVEDPNSLSTELDRKMLESFRGFLVYVAQTYTTMRPFLKGLHLTIDGWRPDRDKESWRIADKPLRDKILAVNDEYPSAPKTVRPAARLRQDLDVLLWLTRDESPPPRLTRPETADSIIIIFGDASSDGFGVTDWDQKDVKELIDTDYGTWVPRVAGRSSNFRKLLNLVLKLERLAAEGKLGVGTEVFLFTDNVVAERAFYRGNSSGATLFELIVRMARLEMQGYIFLHVIWVAGTRMQKQETDGLSRADLTSGIMTGKSPLMFAPLNLTVFDRCPEMKAWCGTFFKSPKRSYLSPEGWYHDGFQNGNFIWAPPPAVADVVLELMCESRHIRPWNSHVFVCPALMTAKWRWLLNKVADFIVSIPVGCPIWPHEMHEPLTLAFIFPLVDRKSWILRDSDLVVHLDASVSRMSWEDPDWVGNRMCEFWESGWSIPTMP
jgi:hypothetical protein